MLFGKQVFRGIRVTQRGINGRVGIGLHKGLHRVINAAGHSIRNGRVLLRKGRVPRHTAHPVRDLPGHGVFCIVRTHGLCQVGRAHRVDAPARAELQCTARQRLARALALFHALAHGVARALQAQHRQHRRRVDGTHGQVLRRAAHSALHRPAPVGQAALGRSGQVLSALVQLVAHTRFRVHAVVHFQPGQPVAHVPDLFRAIAHLHKVAVPAFRVDGVVVHVHVGQQLEQLLGPRIALDLLLHPGPVLLGIRNVLGALYRRLAGHHRAARHAVCNAADGVARPPGRFLPCRERVVCSVLLPCLVDLRLGPAAVPDQVGVGVGPVGVVHPAHRVGQVPVVVRVEPLVQPVEFVLLAVGRIAGLELLRQPVPIGRCTASDLFQHIRAHRHPILCRSAQRLHPAARSHRGARAFTPCRALFIQQGQTRPANGSPFGGAGAKRLRGSTPQPVALPVRLVRKPQIVVCPVFVERLGHRVGVRRLGLLLGA